MSAANQKTNFKKTVDVKMPDGEIKKAVQVFNVQTISNHENQMVDFITRKLRKMGLKYEVDIWGNILVTKGKIEKGEYYPCVTAHMDTVHKLYSDFQVKIITVKNARIAHAESSKGEHLGIGGDDKCGVYGVLYELEHLDVVKAVFFSNEEIGMIGSTNMDWGFFNDVGYLIELDRWGRGDFINILYNEKTTPPEYCKLAKPVLDKYGYKSTEGLITDVMDMWEANIGISAVNVSVGYYMHHTNTEYVDIDELYNSVLFVKDLILNLGNNLYESYPAPSKFSDFEYDPSAGSRSMYKYDDYCTGAIDAIDDLLLENLDLLDSALSGNETTFQNLKVLINDTLARFWCLQLTDYELQELLDEYSRNMYVDPLYFKSRSY